jgi:hypothetical protein
MLLVRSVASTACAVLARARKTSAQRLIGSFSNPDEAFERVVSAKILANSPKLCPLCRRPNSWSSGRTHLTESRTDMPLEL